MECCYWSLSSSLKWWNFCILFIYLTSGQNINKICSLNHLKSDVPHLIVLSRCWLSPLHKWLLKIFCCPNSGVSIHIDADLTASSMLLELGTTFGVSAKSILLNMIPVLMSTGINVTVNFLPECNAIRIRVASFRIYVDTSNEKAWTVKKVLFKLSFNSKIKFLAIWHGRPLRSSQ